MPRENGAAIIDPMDPAKEYCTVWRFRVRPERRAEFIAAYRPGGIWTDLFQRSAEYRSTALLSAESDPDEFWTIDRWSSRTAYEAFRREFGVEYARIDQRCDGFTLSEEHILEGESTSSQTSSSGS